MAKRSRMRYPRPLADLLDEGLKGLGIAERLAEAEIWRIWPVVVGTTIAGRARPLRIIGGTLTVAVSSGPWMQELTFLKGMIRQKLNDTLGKNIVKEIVLKSGKVTIAPEEADEETSPRKRALTARELSQIEEQAAAIPDDETRRAFIDLMKASRELKPL